MTAHARYASYRPAVPTWLRGEHLPSHWRATTVKHLVSAMRAGEAITAEYIESSGAYPVFGGNGVRGYTSAFTHSGEFVLIGRQGALCGNVHSARGRFWASEHAIVCQPSPEVHIKFLAHLMAVMNLGQYSLTAAQPGIGTAQIARVGAHLPPMSEQRAIAAYLDRETAQIDALIGQQERLIETLRERRVALTFRVVTRGVRGHRDLVPSGADWLGSIPSHWRSQRLATAIESSQVGVWGSEPLGNDSDVLCVRVADFDRPKLKVSSQVSTLRSISQGDLQPRILAPGDLLLEKSGGTALNPVGFVVIFEGAPRAAVSSNFVARLRVGADHDPRYWLYALAASYSTRLTARSVKQTTGIQNLDQASFFNEIFPFPPLDEQRRIAAYLDEQTAKIDALIAKAERFIELSKERRAALITAAVTGQIDVREAV